MVIVIWWFCLHFIASGFYSHGKSKQNSFAQRIWYKFSAFNRMLTWIQHCKTKKINHAILECYECSLNNYIHEWISCKLLCHTRFFPSWYKFLVNLLLNKGTNLINHRRATTPPCLTVNMNKLILFEETDAREFILICQLSSYSTCKANGKKVVQTHASFFVVVVCIQVFLRLE